MTNPVNASEKQQTPIWPVPCVQGTPGAEIIQEIDVWSLDKVVDKGRDRRVEMFSAFSDAFGNKSDAASFDLAAVLREAAVSDVYCVGLTGDCCVKCTAIDAKKEGFAVHVIEDGTRSVDPGENGWLAAKREFELAGVKVVSSDSPEVQKIRVLR
ncbi:NAD(+) salvage pathway protein [Bachmanniomyces sp. S44760]|nr:NAD(+) salvage pathway protein [Bachmanniomyces sp. S44760]